jgi:hypothetical protein
MATVYDIYKGKKHLGKKCYILSNHSSNCYNIKIIDTGETCRIRKDFIFNGPRSNKKRKKTLVKLPESSDSDSSNSSESESSEKEIEASVILNQFQKNFNNVSSNKRRKLTESKGVSNKEFTSLKKSLNDVEKVNSRKLEQQDRKLEQQDRKLEQQDRKLEQQNRKLEQQNRKLEQLQNQINTVLYSQTMLSQRVMELMCKPYTATPIATNPFATNPIATNPFATRLIERNPRNIRR